MKTGLVAIAALTLTALPFAGRATDPGLTPASGSVVEVPSAASVVTGLVRDEDTGRPLGGVQIWLQGRTEATLTNPAGRYVLTVDENAMIGREVTLRVGAPGYADQATTVKLTAGAVTRDFALTPTAVLEDRERQEKDKAEYESVADQASASAPATLQARRATPSLAMGASSVPGERLRSVRSFDPDFNTESYAHIEENAFRSVADHPLSTFSIDVDRASYSNLRRFVTQGQRPPIDAVRIEEMINYFHYDYPDARGEHPFSVTTDMMAAPWNPAHRLVRIGVQGRRIDMSDAPPSNLVFLLDVSGSMNSPDKLPLLKQAFRMLANELRTQDRIAIVVYAGAAGLVLESTPGSEKETILEALNSLEAGGSTAGGAGIRLAYQIAQENFIEGGNNRIVLATDGDFNVGASSDSEMIRLIEQKREQGTFLTVLGFGTGNLQDSKMEQIADHGNGNYAYIDSPLEARKVLVTEMGGTLLTIAKDVKIQAEFNPQYVSEYRLVGYENRLLANEDFNDDTKDAGELGAGHSVTVLYEVVPVGTHGRAGSVDPLRYASPVENSRRSRTDNVDASGEMLFVKLRYKAPNGDRSKLITHPILMDDVRESTDLRFAAAVAGFGMLLRESEHAGDLSLSDVVQLAEAGLGEDDKGYRSEFLRLVERVRTLDLLVVDPQ